MTNDKFKFLPDIATADLAFEAFGSTLSELFENAGTALETSMVELSSLEPRIFKNVKLESENLEKLLLSFLEELVFLKDAEQLLFNQIKCSVGKASSKLWIVSGELSGEKIDPQKHKLGVDVKAITKHLFKIRKLPGKIYRCLVVMDI